ncbi:glycosyltransferase [Lacimicrobium sp. SS2-24]|uniref:glycosyltransferase n=1 Tax=Lacimicrobium sp. SS2-24 TaxID=2005569 RepID=UPI000B4B8274|nr:glycosyltransferase [Lacimicrobium sp. SS2-24]
MTTRVLHVFGIMNRGGAELRTLALMPSMQALGYEFHFCVLSGAEGALDDDIRAMGGQIHYLKLGPAFIWRFVRLLKHQHISILHTHVALVSGLLVLLGAIAGVKKRISHLRSTLDTRSSSILRIWRNALLRRCLYRFSHHVLGVCQGALQCQWPDYAQRPKCQVIYNGMALPPIEEKADFWSAWIEGYAGQPVVVHLARMNPAKNHTAVIAIFNAYLSAHEDAFLVLIGKEDPLIKTQLNQFIAEKGIADRVIFLSEQAQPLAFLRHAQALLFPSLWEGLPGAVLESASVGTPVLASAIPGCQEIAKQLKAVETAELKQSPHEWAEHLAMLLKKGNGRASLIEDFKHSDFLLDKNIRALNAVYAN